MSGQANPVQNRWSPPIRLIRLQIGRILTPVALTTWLLLSLIVAVAGPFGTYEQVGLVERFIGWFSIVGVSVVVGRVVRVVVEERFADSPVWQLEVVSIATIVPILTAIISLLVPHVLGARSEPAAEPGHIAAYVFIVAASVSTVRRMYFAGQHRREASRAAAVPRLLRRLPMPLQAEIFRLTGRDHHVEIVTANGSTAIRIRFSDAIAEMEPVEGYCTHRSHWVARAAISGVETEGNRTFLRLVNGDRVPVSQTYRPGLEAAGII